MGKGGWSWTSWIEYGLEELSKWGPIWLIGGVVAIILAIRSPEIIKACGSLWKTLKTTKQKLRNEQEQFDLSMEQRRSISKEVPKSAEPVARKRRPGG